MIFNEACLNNYANLQSTRIKSSDQSFHDYYRVFVTSPITDFWIDSNPGWIFFFSFIWKLPQINVESLKNYARKETFFVLCLHSGHCMSLKVI